MLLLLLSNSLFPFFVRIVSLLLRVTAHSLSSGLKQLYPFPAYTLISVGGTREERLGPQNE